MSADRGAPGRRVGYFVAAGLNAVFLWMAHRLLDWGWPSFLTEDFEDLLGLLSLSFAAGIVTNLVYVVHDGRRTKAAGELTTSVIGFVLTVRTWQVFPFDFSAWSVDWSWLVRLVLLVGLVGTAVSIVVNLVRLLAPAPGRTDPA